MSAKVIHGDTLQEYWFHEGCHIVEVSNDPNDPAVSVARARVEPGTRTRRHSLKQVWERYLIFSGEGMVEVGDRPPTRVRGGDLVSIPPGVAQCIHNPGTVDLVFYAICSPRFTPDCYVDLDDPASP